MLLPKLSSPARRHRSSSIKRNTLRPERVLSSVQLIVVLLAVSAALQLLARRINVPHPVLLVLGGLGLALIPGLPRITIDPNALFLLFVPPLLYWAALNTSLREFRRQFSPIIRYATLVVLLTMTAVALVVRWLAPEFTWPAAFVLGAIVAPPDPVAAIAVLRPLGGPRGMVTILEGEGLVNDATALVAYQIAVRAAVNGTFSPANAALRFVLAAAGGVLIGLVTGWLIAFARTHLIERVPIVENTLSLLSPFCAFIPAQWIGASGVLAVVTLGLYLGRRGPRIVAAATRVQGEATWTMVRFLLESLTFILIGLELPVEMRAMRYHPFGVLLLYGALVTLTVILVRIVYTAIAALLRRVASQRHGSSGPPWREVTFIGWAGMRGGDSLVIALALPLTVATGQRFPARGLILFLTFAVIFGTLVLQGLTLAPLLRRLGLHSDTEDDGEDAHARRVTAEVGLRTLDEVADGIRDAPVVRTLRIQYDARLQRWTARDRPLRTDGNGEHRVLPTSDGVTERSATSYRKLRRAMLDAERNAIVDLRDANEISDDVMRRIQRELDMETMMLDSAEDDADPYDEP